MVVSRGIDNWFSRFLAQRSTHLRDGFATHRNPLSGALTRVRTLTAVPVRATASRSHDNGFAMRIKEAGCQRVRVRASEPRLHTTVIAHHGNAPEHHHAQASFTSLRHANASSSVRPATRATLTHLFHAIPVKQRETRAPELRGPSPIPSRKSSNAKSCGEHVMDQPGISDSGRSVPTACDRPQPPAQEKPASRARQTPMASTSLTIEGARAVDPSATRRHRGGRQVVPGITVAQPSERPSRRRRVTGSTGGDPARCAGGQELR